MASERRCLQDNVGKAFVAYPNLTCVHFTCKEHPSICPKTGKNFSDNLSVYCPAPNKVKDLGASEAKHWERKMFPKSENATWVVFPRAERVGIGLATSFRCQFGS